MPRRMHLRRGIKGTLEFCSHYFEQGLGNSMTVDGAADQEYVDGFGRR